MRVDGIQKPQMSRHVESQRQEESTARQEQQHLKQTREVFRREIFNEESIKEAQKRLQEELERLNQVSRIFDRRMNFLLHEGTNRIMVQVIDIETDRVIREIPPHEILDIISKMHTMIGLFLDEYV